MQTREKSKSGARDQYSGIVCATGTKKVNKKKKSEK